MTASYKNLYCLLILLVLAEALHAQQVVQVKGYNQLYLLDMAAGAESLLYTSVYPEIRTVKVSPDGSLFALLEVDHTKESPVNYLKVLDANGRLKYEGHPDVREYTWDLKSNRLAYITGTFREGEVSFNPTGFYLYDFVVDEEARLATDGFKPFALTWVSNSVEDAIYVESISREVVKRFQRYVFLRKTFETIPARSIDMSPDGKYYSNYEVSCGCVKIFASSTQREQSRIYLSDGEVPVGWVYNESHLYAVKEISYSKAQHEIFVGGERKTATINGSVRDARIIIVDGSDGQQVQSICGVLPDSPPYQFMFTKPDVLITIPPDVAENARHMPAGSREQITITTIPEKYRQ